MKSFFVAFLIFIILIVVISLLKTFLKISTFKTPYNPKINKLKFTSLVGQEKYDAYLRIKNDKKGKNEISVAEANKLIGLSKKCLKELRQKKGKISLIREIENHFTKLETEINNNSLVGITQKK